VTAVAQVSILIWETLNINSFELNFSSRCIVSGHDFSRAESDCKRMVGFSPCVKFYSMAAIPQRLKPNLLGAVCGTTEVVP
jgi:hypothetical protein